MTPNDHALAQLALGRILRLASRPTQPGDVEQYEACRAIILDDLDGAYDREDRAPNYARDRFRGSAGS